METILCAAIWLKDYDKPIHTVRNLDKGVVLCGYRHCDIISQFTTLTSKRLPEEDYEHGFLTSEKRFLNRKEAFQIAAMNGQLDDQTLDLKNGKWELYSEDLY